MGEKGLKMKEKTLAYVNGDWKPNSLVKDQVNTQLLKLATTARGTYVYI